MKSKTELMATKFYCHLTPKPNSGTKAKTDNLKPISQYQENPRSLRVQCVGNKACIPRCCMENLVASCVEA